MLPFDFIGQASVGSLFALGAREQLRKEPRPLHTRAFVDLVLFSTLVYTPSIVFFVATWPSWYVMYTIDVESPKIGIALLAVVNIYGQAVCAVAGFWGTARYLRWKPRISAAHVVYAVLAVWAVQLPVYFFLCWSRSFTTVHFSEYTHRPGYPIDWGASHSFWGGPILPWWLFWVFNDVCFLTWFYRRLRTRARALLSGSASAPEDEVAIAARPAVER
jgi:hypothetical protein